MYGAMIKDARAFYGALAQNNKRDWWLAHKDTYDTHMKAPALALLDALTPALSDVADAPVTGKLFRPHRDVRFSKDKTPYNTHLHMMWTIESDARQAPVFFFGIGLDYVSAGLGMMAFEKDVLTDWRKMVDLDGDRIGGLVTAAQADGFTFRAPALKRVPPPYDKAHPLQDLLRMKGMVLSRELGTDAVIPDDVIAAFRAGWPVADMLHGIAAG